MKIHRTLHRRIYSGDNLVNLTDIRYLPRWVILVIDLLFLALSISLSRYLIEKLALGAHRVFEHNAQMHFVIMLTGLVYMYIFRTYAGIIRHSTFIDLFKLFLATFSTTVTVGAFNFLYLVFTDTRLIYMSVPFLALFFASSFMLLFMFRLAVKEFFHLVREFRRSSQKKRILVLGIAEPSVAVARAVMDKANLPY